MAARAERGGGGQDVNRASRLMFLLFQAPVATRASQC